MRDCRSIHIKHRRDVSGHLNWWEQPNVEFKHYYLKNGQPKHETLQHFALNHSNFQLFTILQYFEKPESKNGTIMNYSG